MHQAPSPGILRTVLELKTPLLVATSQLSVVSSLPTKIPLYQVDKGFPLLLVTSIALIIKVSPIITISPR